MAEGGHLGDILFTLDACGACEGAGDWDAVATASIVAAYDDFAGNLLSPADPIADREGARLIDGRVRVPAVLERAYGRYVERGLHLAGLPEGHEGLGAPPAVVHAATEILAAHGHAFQMLVGLVPGGARLLGDGLPADRADALLGALASGATLVTMAMTEPAAGSDLSAIATRATRVTGPGTGWRIDGNKIFISGADQSMTAEILHFVLARTGVDEGRAELSLFAVTTSDDDRNGVEVRRLEEKLGLHASPTCDVVFHGSRAHLISAPGEGLRRMFTLMNHARLDVAAQAVGHAARTTELAAAYALERRQGRDMDGQPIAIADHGDVRRMLADMQATTFGLRAMVALAAGLDDAGLAGFVTPVCKAYCTDEGQRVVDLGIQVLGGYGYLREYEIERHWRDCRVTRLYEGTNGIQAMTLVGRGLDDTRAVEAFRTVVAGKIANASPAFRTAAMAVVDVWSEAVDAVRTNVEPGAAAAPFLHLTAYAWYLAAWSCLEAKADTAPLPQRVRALARYVAAGADAEVRYLAAAVHRHLTPEALPEIRPWK